MWSSEEGVLYWVDSLAPALNRFDPANGSNIVFDMPSEIGSFALDLRGGTVVALRSGFHRFDLKTRNLHPIVDPEAGLTANRLNDGRCDPQGRFWCGSMTPGNSGPACNGALYRLDVDGQCTRIVDGLATSNGLAFSPDGSTMYVSDSHPRVRTIWAFDFDSFSGLPFNRRVFAETAGMPGRPDGAAVDVDGCYWSAAVDGGELVRYAPSGRVDRRVPMPVPRPTMPAFGGADLRTLYVTSIRTPDCSPNATDGGIFALDAGVAGLPEPRFAG